MSLIITAMRRSFVVLLVGAAGGAAWAWWRDRDAPLSPSAPAEWPPLVAVDAIVWAPPDDDGSCPLSHPLKANGNSGIFHVPGGRFYDRTKAERCYATADAAVADGYRQAKA